MHLTAVGEKRIASGLRLDVQDPRVRFLNIRVLCLALAARFGLRWPYGRSCPSPLPAGGQDRVVPSLFRGREDVYPRRFESRKTGKAGYSPACANEWVRGMCEKPASSAPSVQTAASCR